MPSNAKSLAIALAIGMCVATPVRADNWLYSEYQRIVAYSHDNRNLHDARLTHERSGQERWTLRLEFSSSSHVRQVTQIAFSNDRTGRSGGWVAYDKEDGVCRTIDCYAQVRGTNRIAIRLSFAPYQEALRPGDYRYAVFRLRLADGGVSYFFLSMERYKDSLRRMMAATSAPPRAPVAATSDSVARTTSPERKANSLHRGRTLNYLSNGNPYAVAQRLLGMMNSCWMKSRARRNNWFGSTTYGQLSPGSQIHEFGVVDINTRKKELIVTVDQRGPYAQIIVSGSTLGTDVDKELRRDMASWSKGRTDCPPM